MRLEAHASYDIGVKLRLLFCTLFVTALFAQAPNTLSPEEKKAGWRLLFDGRTFHGWRDPAKSVPPGDAWAIEDGTIKTLKRP